MISIQYSDDPKLQKFQKFVLWTVVGLFAVVAFGLIFGFLIQFLWNATLVEMFGFPTLSFWQAIGIFILAKFFFGFGGGSNSNQKSKRKKGGDAQELAVDSEPASEFTDDETFRKYWQEEGKASYEAFRRGNAESESQES